MSRNTSFNLDETRLDALRQALIAGEQSGAATELDFDEYLARKRTGPPET